MNAFIGHYGHNSTYRHRIGLKPRVTPRHILPRSRFRHPRTAGQPVADNLRGGPRGFRWIREGPSVARSGSKKNRFLLGGKDRGSLLFPSRWCAYKPTFVKRFLIGRTKWRFAMIGGMVVIAWIYFGQTKSDYGCRPLSRALASRKRPMRSD